MSGREKSNIPKGKRAAYIAAGCVMGVLLIAGIHITFLLGLYRGAEDYLKLTVSVIGMLFSVILFLCCCFGIRDDTHRGDVFA